ncbi:unknown protein [Rivularia sp. IAM M-261]|nr:unknown protein [Rivularia sp. IAM M-261]
MSTVVISSVNPFSLLEKSTVSLLDAAFNLKEYKEHYSLEEYLALLHKNGWKLGGAEEKRLLSIAETFAPFIHNIQALAKIEPKTIYQLCQEKLAPVIAKLQNVATITQDIVVKLIRSQQNFLRKNKNGMSRTDGWKYRKSGRFYRLELLEGDDWTGKTIEALRSKGHGATEIIRNAMQLLVQQPGWKVENINTPEESEATESEKVVLEPVQVPPGSIPTCFQAQEDVRESEIPPQAEKLPFLEVKDEEVAILVEKLELATSYYQIRSAVYRHLAVKDKAWEQLSSVEKTRIEKLLPQEVKILNQARESGLILDYYELETGSFHIFIAGEDKPVSVSKSSIVSWLKEQERINCVTI